MDQFDLVIIGSGPAGYTGAIRAAQLGMKVACIEKRSTLGGTCLNVGCIPSKALLHASEKYYQAKHHYDNIGIIADVKLDLTKMISNKDKVVNDLCKGIEGLFNKNKITKFTGIAKILNNGAVEVTNDNKTKLIQAKNILIATGSRSIDIPNILVDEKMIVSSSGALGLESVPNEMIVIGGGYIGIELGSVWHRLGSKVTIIESSNTIVPALDVEIGKQFYKILQKQGINFKLETKVIKAQIQSKQVELSIENILDSKIEQLKADVILVAVGRRPNTSDLGLEIIGVELNERGQIKINQNYQTSVQNIYAVGDVTPGPMLAHKAEEEAIAAIEIIAGFAGHVNYKIIPSVVYTSPEVASIGATEEELKKDGIVYNIGKFPFIANSRARTINMTDGLVKILADSKTDRVLGAHIIGQDAGTMIGQIAAVMEFGGAAEDVARTCHAHPTLNEAIKEAALAVDKRAINF